MQIDGALWFVERDVCPALGFRENNGSYWSSTRTLSADERRTVSTSDVEMHLPKGRLSVIAESGLYRLVLRSDKPQARAFQDWVTREVLPAIRKDSAYVMGEEKMRDCYRLGAAIGVC